MQRFDTTTIKAVKTDEGFVRDTPIVGRTGLLTYQNADGSTRIEYRPPEEAFNADSLASLQGKPITIGHKGMVNSSNAVNLAPVGTVLSAGKEDGETIKADIVIYSLNTDARELSCGYTLDLDETPGITPDGKHYDAVQRNIRYNHLAIVPRGRAGIARLNMDGDQIEIEEKGEKTMEKIRIDSGLEYEAAAEVCVYVDKLRQDIAGAKKAQDELQAKYDAAIADLEAEKKVREDEAKKQKEAFDSAVKERVALLEVAKAHKIEKADEMTGMEIKKAVVKSVRDLNLDGKSEDYINAAFDLCKEEKHEDGMKKAAQSVNQTKQENNDSVVSPEEALRKLKAEEAALWTKEVK